MTAIKKSETTETPWQPTDFQAAAVKRVSEVLKTHGISFGEFQINRGAKTALWVSFIFQEEEHLLAIFDDEINMTCGRGLYEPYMPEEFVSDEALLDGFVTRLDRYLSGGPWEGPGEKSSLGHLMDRLRRSFRR